MYQNNASGGLDFFSDLKSKGHLEYGSTVTVAKVQKLLGIVVPELGSKKEFGDLALQEMAMIEYVRKHLVKEGKYIQLNGSAYRVLLPSENAKKVKNLMESGNRKYRRAQSLHRNTPKTDGSPTDCNVDVRIAAKLNASKEAIQQAKMLS